jgi:hypothetical protein
MSASSEHWRTCVHEAGHAVACVIVGARITSISIDGDYGSIRYRPPNRAVVPFCAIAGPYFEGVVADWMMAPNLLAYSDCIDASYYRNRRDIQRCGEVSEWQLRQWETLLEPFCDVVQEIAERLASGCTDVDVITEAINSAQSGMTP